MTRLEVLIRELVDVGVLDTINFTGRQAYQRGKSKI